MKVLLSFFTALLLILGGFVSADEHTDQALLRNIRAKISADPSIATNYIEISVVNGVVSLSGMVDTAQQEQTIINMAQTVYGVRSVVSNLTVRGVQTPPVPGQQGVQPITPAPPNAPIIVNPTTPAPSQNAPIIVNPQPGTGPNTPSPDAPIMVNPEP